MRRSLIVRAAELAVERDLPQLRVTALNGLANLAACRPGGDYETPLREALDIALELDLQRQAGLVTPT